MTDVSSTIEPTKRIVDPVFPAGQILDGMFFLGNRLTRL